MDIKSLFTCSDESRETNRAALITFVLSNFFGNDRSLGFDLL